MFAQSDPGHAGLPSRHARAGTTVADVAEVCAAVGAAGRGAADACVSRDRGRTPADHIFAPALGADPTKQGTS